MGINSYQEHRQTAGNSSGEALPLGGSAARLLTLPPLLLRIAGLEQECWLDKMAVRAQDGPTCHGGELKRATDGEEGPVG